MARMAPSSEYLFRLDQPAMKTDSSVDAPTAKEEQNARVQVQRHEIRPYGSTA